MIANNIAKANDEFPSLCATCKLVMPGLVPGIHIFGAARK